MLNFSKIQYNTPKVPSRGQSFKSPSIEIDFTTTFKRHFHTLVLKNSTLEQTAMVYFKKNKLPIYKKLNTERFLSIVLLLLILIDGLL